MVQNKASFEGSQIQLLTSKFGLSQIITEPTHILEMSRSCIDLIFTSQPNVVTVLDYMPLFTPTATTN